MRIDRKWRVIAGFTLLLTATTGTSAAYQIVEFASHHNGNMQSQLINGGDYPTGNLVLGGVPFFIPTSGDNYWHAVNEVGSNPIELSLAVSIPQVTEVHTLMNTFWGVFPPSSRARIEFTGSGGAFHAVELFGNVDIRDFNQNAAFPNNINGTTTINVFNNGSSGQRLDKQLFALPAIFASETLTEIKLIDTGATNVQRIFLSGVTVQTVPLPSALLTLIAAVSCLFGFRRS